MESICNIPTLVASDRRVTVGRFTYGEPRLMLWDEGERIEIGSFCSIADNVTIFAGGEHNSAWVTTYPLRIALGDELAGKDGHPASKGPTIIGHDVWIGFGATILSGVTIGDGAIIGACSVVVKDVPPYQIVAGNPAGIIRQRFKDEHIKKLCDIQWWNWPLSRIKKYAHLLCGPDVNSFIQKIQLNDF